MRSGRDAGQFGPDALPKLRLGQRQLLQGPASPDLRASISAVATASADSQVCSRGAGAGRQARSTGSGRPRTVRRRMGATTYHGSRNRYTRPVSRASRRLSADGSSRRCLPLRERRPAGHPVVRRRRRHRADEGHGFEEAVVGRLNRRELAAGQRRDRGRLEVRRLVVGAAASTARRRRSDATFGKRPLVMNGATLECAGAGMPQITPAPICDVPLSTCVGVGRLDLEADRLEAGDQEVAEREGRAAAEQDGARRSRRPRCGPDRRRCVML